MKSVEMTAAMDERILSSLRDAKRRSNLGAIALPSAAPAPHVLPPLDCFVARAPRNDGVADAAAAARRLFLARLAPR
jgi:hypothetical protein